MGEVTYTVPVIGEAVTVACPKVDTALTEVKTQINGKVEAINVKNESLTVDKIAKSGKWVAEGTFGAAIKKSEHFEREPSATENALVMLNLIFANAFTCTVEVKVAGVLIAKPEFAAAVNVAVGAFRVPAGEKWLVEVTAGSTGELLAGSTFAYMKGVV